MSTPERALIYTDYPSGEARIREVMRLVFYLNRPHQSIADQVRAMIDAFIELVSLDSLGYFFDLQGEAQSLSWDAYAALMHSWFSGQLRDYPNCTIEMISRNTLAPEFKIHYCGKALESSECPGDVGFLDLCLSRDFFLTQRKAVEQLFQRGVSALSPCSAYLSPALSGEDVQGKQALARRYVCLDIASPASVSIDLDEKCPGSYWTTILPASAARRLSGMASMTEVLGPGVVVSGTDVGSVSVRLTPDPELGDRNRRAVPRAHMVFEDLLQRSGLLHVPRRTVYFEDADGLADPEAQEAWHLRFTIGADES